MGGIKCFNVQLPVEIWSFLKKDSVERQETMTKIIIELIQKYKNKKEKMLTPYNT
jgi:hypothetical protein